MLKSFGILSHPFRSTIIIIILSLEPAADAVFASCSQGDLLHCSLWAVSLLQLVICNWFLCLSNCGGDLESSGDTVLNSSWPTSPAVCHKINWNPFFLPAVYLNLELGGMILSILGAFSCFRPWCQHILLQLLQLWLGSVAQKVLVSSCSEVSLWMKI